MAASNKKDAARLRRKRSIRKRIRGTAERPRLSVFRSNKHIYAQVVDDDSGRTLVAASTLSETLRGGLDDKKKSEAAAMVGELIARQCLAQNIEAVVFDRNGFIYHGRVKAVADAAREAGLRF
ncbi:MAG: 50S ribosomal protein L18 [bacterium]|nr:50S ribosomal protein L18 [Myxococcales bacterium]